MAEIKIERKIPIIPWLLGLLLLLAIGAGVYFAFYYGNNAEEEAVANEVTPNEILPVETEVIQTNTLPAAVNDFITFANEENQYADGEMEIHHQYTSDAIRKMADALVAIADKKGMAQQMNIQDLRTKLRADADEIQKNWKSTDHADHIKQAFLKVSGAVNQLSDANENLKKEANDIDVNKLTLDQKADVKDFIRKTANVMEQLAI